MPPADSSVLVLEDEPAILQLVTIALHSGGLENVCAASSLREARLIWEDKAGNFDLLLTDFSLPDGTAIQLIEDLLVRKPELKVILMSGYSQEMLGLSTKASRKVTLMEKPFRPSELRNLVVSRLEQPALV